LEESQPEVIAGHASHVSTLSEINQTSFFHHATTQVYHEGDNTPSPIIHEYQDNGDEFRELLAVLDEDKEDQRLVQSTGKINHPSTQSSQRHFRNLTIVTNDTGRAPINEME
jgi:hypothetical protein